MSTITSALSGTIGLILAILLAVSGFAGGLYIWHEHSEIAALTGQLAGAEQQVGALKLSNSTLAAAAKAQDAAIASANLRADAAQQAASASVAAHSGDRKKVAAILATPVPAAPDAACKAADAAITEFSAP